MSGTSQNLSGPVSSMSKEKSSFPRQTLRVNDALL